MPIVAWYVLSKESYMNRVMSDVFPTKLTQTYQHAIGAHRSLSIGHSYRSALLGRQACITPH
jgi:hypothetical protein